MSKSSPFEPSTNRAPRVVAIATAFALVFSACAHGVDSGLDFAPSGGGPPSGITGTTGSAGPSVASSSSGTGGRGGSSGSSGGGGFAGSDGIAGATNGAGTGGSMASGGAAGATGIGGGSATGGSGGAGPGGTGAQAGAGGQGGSGGRDGGVVDAAGGMGGAAGGADGAGGGTPGSAGAAGTSGAGGVGGVGGMGGTGVVVRDAGPLVSFDDSVVGTGNHQFNYAGTWSHCAPCTTATTPPLYNTTNSWADGTSTTQIVTFAFVGSEILFYGVQDPRNGIGAFSIDGGAEMNVDFYSAARGGNRLVWTSPFLPAGAHTLRVRATGTKNASSTALTITVDRVEVH